MTTRVHLVTPAIMQGHDPERDPSASTNLPRIVVRESLVAVRELQRGIVLVGTPLQARQLAYQLLEAADELEGWQQRAAPIARGT